MFEPARSSRLMMFLSRPLTVSAVGIAAVTMTIAPVALPVRLGLGGGALIAVFAIAAFVHTLRDALELSKYVNRTPVDWSDPGRWWPVS